MDRYATLCAARDDGSDNFINENGISIHLFKSCESNDFNSSLASPIASCLDIFFKFKHY